MFPLHTGGKGRVSTRVLVDKQNVGDPWPNTIFFVVSGILVCPLLIVWNPKDCPPNKT